MSQRANDARIFAPWETLLLMNRNRVVRLGIDTVLDQVVNHCVAIGRVLRFDLVQVEHMAIPRASIRQVEEIAARQALGVLLRDLNPAVAPGFDVLELRAQNTSVQVIQTAVETKAVYVALI